MKSPFQPHVNLWLEVEGEVALSRWRAELLQAVDHTGSISAAAQVMNVQYRLAWQRIREMEDRLGLSLIESTVGGKGGGGTKLTPGALQLIEQFLKLAKSVDAYSAKQSRLYLKDWLDEENRV